MRDVSRARSRLDLLVLLVKVLDFVPQQRDPVLVGLQLLLDGDDLLPVVDLLLLHVLVLKGNDRSVTFIANSVNFKLVSPQAAKHPFLSTENH